MRPALILHGGAGAPSPDLHDARHQGLRRAFGAAWAVLLQNGTALDAVVRAVVELVDDPVFNAGVGSCVFQEGNVEGVAALMEGTTFQVGGVGAVRAVV